MLNKKAFTLIELLAVIVILAIIMVIAVPSILKKIEEVRIEGYKKSEIALVKATELYLVNNIDKLPINIGDIRIVELNELKDNKLIKDVVDSKTKEECTARVVVSKKGVSEYNYNPYIECGTNYKTYNDYITDGLILHLDGYDAPQNISGKNYWMDKTNNGNNAEMLGFDSSSGHNVSQGNYYFDGLNDNMKVLHNQTQEFEEGTFSFLIKAVSWDTTGANCLLIKRAVAGLGAYFIFTSTSTGIVYWDFGGSAYRWVTGYSPQLNNWVNIVLTKNSFSRKLYVNGTLVQETTSLGVLLVDAADIYIGADMVGNRYFYKGNMSRVSIYNRALTQEEIQYNYNLDKLRFGL